MFRSFREGTNKMELYKRLTPDFRFRDERGSLVQLVHSGYEQINVLTTKAGVVRGKHYHKETEEAFFVVDGRVTVVFERDNERQTVCFVKDDFFCIYPWVRHTMQFDEDTLMVAMYEHCVELTDGTKDIYDR